jgi:hypothetical protein
VISSLVNKNILKLYNNLNKKIDINILFVYIIGIKYGRITNKKQRIL